MFALCIESSHARGMGHFYRALNLSQELAASGILYKFYLNDHAPSRHILVELGVPHRVVNLKDFTSNWEANLIQQDNITLWVNDRLNTEAGHAHKIRATGVPLVTFDDRGTGAEFANLHIAALAFDCKEHLGGERLLRGVDYLILNSKIGSFIRLRKQLKSILVTLGGSDTYGVTVKAVRFLKDMNLVATVVVGPGFMHMDELNAILTEGFILKHSVPSMIEEFHCHDLAITGGGITPFEANASGLPCVVIANELFEIPVGKELQRLGGALFAGHHESLHSPLFSADLNLQQMSQAGMCNIGLQGTKLVISELMAISK
ncbi:spsG Spore coat polysaccharide biosynthesis protein, predicted glycosyltransferase [Methylophilaceae bacterium]